MALVPEYAVKDQLLDRILEDHYLREGAKNNGDFRISDLVRIPDGTDT